MNGEVGLNRILSINIKGWEKYCLALVQHANDSAKSPMTMTNEKVQASVNRTKTIHSM